MTSPNSKKKKASKKKAERKTRSSGKRTYVTPEGNEYPSATTILQVVNKPALVPWAAKQERLWCVEAATELYELLDQSVKFAPLVYQQVLNDKIGFLKKYQKELTEAADIGTQVHNRIEWEIKDQLKLNIDEVSGERTPVPPLDTIAAQNSFLRFAQWEQTVMFEPLKVEQIVWSDTFQYAGTFDWIAMVNGVLTLGDWKTGKRIYPEVAMQLSSYVMAMVEQRLLKPPIQGCCVRLPKVETDPEAEIKLYSWEELLEAFEAFKACAKLFHWQGGMKGE